LLPLRARQIPPDIATKASIDIVLPCYNPPAGWLDNLVSNIAALRQHYAQRSIKCIVVNDGSREGIGPEDAGRLKDLVDDLQWIAYPANRGKGYALRTGVLQSRADVIMYTDIDFPYSAGSMAACLNTVLNGEADLALAVRNTSYYAQLPAFRRFISKLLRLANHVLLRMRTSDTQGGLKVFNHRGKDIFLSTTIDRYLFDLEFIYLASKQEDIKIQPIEADLREGVEFTSVRMGILLREGWNFVRLLLKD
jgi:glycosyltransferase involved in cell wall biosynthesis